MLNNDKAYIMFDHLLLASADKASNWREKHAVIKIYCFTEINYLL